MLSINPGARQSLLDAEGLVEQAALRQELSHGQAALTVEAQAGAARFTGGAGRSGGPA